jgi:hypothetical protein
VPKLRLDEKNLHVKPWRYEYMSENEFIGQAQNVDILLFQTKGARAKVTRKITHSKYDHVAMLLRFQPEPNEVFILDSTSAGVQVSRWS